MNRPRLSPEECEALSGLLRRRLEIIADTGWRDRDSDGHLEALKTVSEEIAARHVDLRDRMHPRLEHFMSNCSYQKALEYLESELIP